MNRRDAARAFGLHAENFAALWLRLKFFTILARNYAASGGEIDIIARRDRLGLGAQAKGDETGRSGGGRLGMRHGRASCSIKATIVLFNERP